MSFLKGLTGLGAGAAALAKPGVAGGSGVPQVNPGHVPMAPPPTAGARGLGRLIGADPSRISGIADTVGQVSNAVAKSAGMAPSYAPPAGQPQPGPMPMPNVRNPMQLLDPQTLQSLISYFQSSPARGQNQMERF